MNLNSEQQGKHSTSKMELLTRLDRIVDFAEDLKLFKDLLGNPNNVTLAISRDSLVICQTETGALFNWEIRDPRTAIACLAVAGEYEPRETALIKIITEHCESVVDVGANVGYYAINIPLMSSNISKVYAFEPLKSVYDQLQSNVELNNLDARVEPFNVAVSNNENNIELYVPNMFGSSATSSVELHPEVSNNKVIVKSATLDSYYHKGIIKNCDFIKIDVEGAEKFVLEGAQDLLSSERPVILAEILRKWSLAQGYKANDIVSMLAALNYECYSIGENLKKVLEISEDVKETNFLFLNLDNPKHTIIQAELGLTQ